MKIVKDKDDDLEITAELYPKLLLICFLKIPKSDDDAILILKVLLQSKIQIYYAEIIAKENYEYFVTKSVVSYNYLFLR